jgi:hypothetical protein
MSEFETSTPPPPKPSDSNPMWAILGFIIASAGAAVLYRMTIGLHYGHTSLMFIGFPAVLAILLALTPKAKSATGAIVKGITLALLITAPLLGEGYVCILISAPLFYLVGVIIGAIVDWNRKKRGLTLSCCALVLIPLSLEGVVPQLTFNRLQTVEATRIVNATPAEVEAALGRSPRIATPLPRFLAIGFPRPLEVHGEGLAVGSIRTVHFSGAEGDPPGDLVVRVAASSPGYLRTETVSDASKLTQWVRWDNSEVTWRPIDATHTSVTWRITFERQLDPAWYFIPWERFAVHEVAGYMIQANATP